MSVQIARVYGWVKQLGQYAVLVDRIWPRGVKKDALGHDEWAKHLAPTTELRKWFFHDPEKWPELQKRYREELQDQSEELQRLRQIAEKQEVVLLYSARDEQHNQAIILRDVIESMTA